MTTLAEFLDGDPLVYQWIKGEKIEATYRAGVGVFLERVRDGHDLGCADVTEDLGASRVYYNLTRRAPDDIGGDEEED